MRRFHHPRTTRAGRLRAPRLAASLPLLAGVLLAGCGGSSSAQSAAAKERSQEAKAETRNADFARCLREHGVNAEAGTGANGGRFLKVRPGKAGGGPEAMEAAQRACARYRPEAKKVSLSPQQQVADEEAVQKFARCMREHGIKVEASAKGGGIRITGHLHPGSGEPNPESPGFQRAQSACQKLLPKPPGGGPGGPGASKSDGPESGAGGS
jgi:hypothetical protein